MGSYRLIDPPLSRTQADYDRISEKLLNLLAKQPGLCSLYALGNVSEPGISDLDLLCVFEDNIHCSLQISSLLSAEERYLLPHAPFASSLRNLDAALNQTYFTNFKLLSGTDVIQEKGLHENKSADLKQQIALEFILIFYISLHRQIQLKNVKWRGFLLSCKALKFDLQLLNIHTGPIHSLVEECIQLRQQFFTYSLHEAETKSRQLIEQVYKECRLFLSETLHELPFFLPQAQFQIARNISIVKSDHFQVKQQGFSLPGLFSFGGKYYHKIENRFSNFEFHVPYQLPAPGSKQEERFAKLSEIRCEQQSFFPNFIPLSTGFNFFYGQPCRSN
ncbi:MAG: hypothetical protein EP338_02250 [Bacteroidetes bacterium]|nr:MAG: hypothetical protein EP338_02250 [Bacteroidota bacterium]